jgi:hypothetical protein
MCDNSATWRPRDEDKAVAKIINSEWKMVGALPQIYGHQLFGFLRDSDHPLVRGKLSQDNEVKNASLIVALKFVAFQMKTFLLT